MKDNDIEKFIKFVKGRELYNSMDFIPLHAPVFRGSEKKYLNDCIDSTFVSSVGKYVTKFEEMLEEFTGAKKAVAVSNGTSGIHAALFLLGVESGDEVITQALTFVATCNAISMVGAKPVFVDVDRDTMGMSPKSLKTFLENHCEIIDGETINKQTGNRVKACIPMHTFGNPLRIEDIVEICSEWNIDVLEDAAESLGSYVNGIHTGLFGKLGVLSFNGNKTVTTGGGGAIITNDVELAKRAKHLTTTAKVPHRWEFRHDSVAFNYRMPNINAALGCAQLEQLKDILKNKRETTAKYIEFFSSIEDITFVTPISNMISNNWLNAVITENKDSREKFLTYTNNNNVMTRPIWILMNKLPMYKNCYKVDLTNSEWLEDRVVNIPSGVTLEGGIE